jgi:hypothetical protein
MEEQNSTQSSAPEHVRTALILVAILTTILGQILLYTTPVNETVAIPSAVWLSLAGVGLFVIAQFLPPLPFLQRITARFAQNSPAIWVLFAALLSILAAVASYLFRKYALTNFIPVVTFWLLGAFCYVIAFFSDKTLQRDWKAWFIEHRQELFWLGLVSILGIVLRFYKLGELPTIIDGDEARIGLFAQETAAGTLANPFALWENIGALYLQFINVFIAWFGPSPFSLRLLPAVAGSLAVFATYLFARQVAGKRVALITAILLATSHTHIHFSRIVAVSYIQGTWLIPLELYFLLSGLEKHSSWRTALGGVLLAIHMSIYISAQITLGILLVYTLVALFWLKNNFRPAWRQILVFWGGFLITFIPEAAYILRKPTEFLNRINQDGTYNSGWMANEILVTGKSAVQILIERVIHAFLSLIYYPAIDFYGSPTPVLSFVSAVLFLLGLSYVFFHARSLKLLLLNGYFWGITVAVGVFAIPPSADSYRMLIALPAAFLISAIGLDYILAKLGMDWESKPFNYAAITTLLLASLLFFNLWVYFFDFAGKCRYGGDPQTRFASYLGAYVKTVDKESGVYLLSDDVFRYGTHSSVDFLTQKRAIINVPGPIDAQSLVSGETIIASPNRIDELRAWVREHPGGQIQIQYDCQKPILLGYQIP